MIKWYSKECIKDVARMAGYNGVRTPMTRGVGAAGLG